MKRGARLGSPEWLEERRSLVTGTDIPVILGLSPYKTEAQLADEKRGLIEPDPPNAAMRLGSFIEQFVASEYAQATGRKVRRVNHLVIHPSFPWAAASLDREVVGDRRLVEIKTTSDRRWDDGLPQLVEAQVRWQMGVAGYPRADVAVWMFGGRGEALRVHELEHDPELFAGLLDVGADFRRRLEDGGPFRLDNAYLATKYPRDNGVELVADADLVDAAKALHDVRSRIDHLRETESHLEVAIKSRMAEASSLTGEYVDENGNPIGFRITWRQTKDRTETDWKGVADELLARLPEPDRAKVIGTHETVRPGPRPFRAHWGKEGTE